ncbi:oxygen-independent coproporphyrinogen III oxidase [Psychromonas sp.]|uniref:oxygen-independent coproporphyrinogen III oxidase n=1 Tax=Psychromonas sp. TaxID=1884585 RepID=UPI003562A388
MKNLQFFNAKLLSKYNVSGPRYTSYPTALEFTEKFDNDELNKAIKNSPNNGLSLYVHIPFCHRLCYYCGCNKVVTRQQGKTETYLAFLEKEIRSRAEYFKDYTIKQMHWGGGTPTFLSYQQISHLVSLLKANFNLADDAEISIEVDPREIELEMADHLRSVGFNRISIGVQDIDPKVQKAINREQSTDFICALIERAKDVGFKSINIDLIYGLPFQSVASFSKTLDKVKEMDPHRISLFSYAHLPSRFSSQRKLRDEWLPNVEQKFALMKHSIETLCSFGYEFIGMDHFAKPDDELAVAQREGVLHRNFQGYTTLGECDLLGLGVSSISAIGNAYSQNKKELKAYYQAVDAAGHAVEKGLTLNQDDLIRGAVIHQLMCNLYLDKEQINDQYNIDFDSYFTDEIQQLKTFIDDDLLVNTNQYIKIDQAGRLLVRNICMSFDAYMKAQVSQQRFSRVI